MKEGKDKIQLTRQFDPFLESEVFVSQVERPPSRRVDHRNRVVEQGVNRGEAVERVGLVTRSSIDPSTEGVDVDFDLVGDLYTRKGEND